MLLGPRSMGQGQKSSHSPQHKHSTKQLISRYESMSNSNDQVASGTSLESSMGNASARSPAGKSPVRQSLRNLFSALKKVNLRKGKPVERPLISYKKQHHLVYGDHPELNAPPVLRSRSRKLTSSLLYLSRTSQLRSDSSDLKAVWISCTATLEPGAIVITSLARSGDSSVHIVELCNCTDVRSLSIQQLDPEENALLPRKGENDEFKVFEILFEGRPREKFAANSVQERAGWVSAVWDTVLPTQDQNRNKMSDNPQDLHLLENVDDLAKVPSYDMRSRSLSQRALPPIPMNQGPLTITLRTGSQMSSSPVSLNIQPMVRSVSRASSGQVSRSTSPSIANLSQLSVVRQRLAQIKTTSSPRISEGGLKSHTSPTSSISTRLTSPVPSLRSELEPMTIHAMMRDESGQSSAADSILDSYGDQSLKSPDLNFLPPLMSLPELETKNTSDSQVQIRSAKRLSHHVLLQGHSKKSCNKINSLCEQILSLRDDVHSLPCVMAATVDNGGQTNRVLEMVTKLEQQARLNGEILGSINSKVDRCNRTSVKEDDVTKAIRALQADVKQGLTHIRTILESQNEETVIKLNNVAPSASQPEGDISHFNPKIEGLLATCSDKQVLSVTNVEKALADISSLIERDGERQGLQAQQQSETVRYLTELNSWLEAFIKHDRVQNHSLSVKIDQLCRDLNTTEGGSTLIADIRRLAQSTIARDHGFIALQASLDGLFAILNENSVETSCARLATLIDHQRQHQEQLIRALGTEISDEIKGERLRFVEAMKEATAINVQIHVDQFKQELKREVGEMTEEVVRLHQDRQAMQNQIADLFAFYRKQTAVVENDQPCTPHQRQVRRAGRQLLPHPGQVG